MEDITLIFTFSVTCGRAPTGTKNVDLKTR